MYKPEDKLIATLFDESGFIVLIFLPSRDKTIGY